jgi:hypothetical protein
LKRALMGDFAKRWMAAIAVAVALVIIASNAIGRMERKSTPAPGTRNAAVVPKSAPSPKVEPLPASSSANASAGQSGSAVKSAEIGNEAASTATPQNAAGNVSKPQHMAAGRTQPQTASSSSIASGTAQLPLTATHSQAVAQTQAQVSPAQPPLSPPDSATPPAQQLTQGIAEPHAMEINQTTGAMKTTGKVDLNGTFRNETALVYLNDKIVTPERNGALVTAEGNSITLGTNAEFTAQPNSFLLDSGASSVNTATGMAAKVKEYTITPVDPKLATHYEVKWERDGVYVYARAGDLEITGPCRQSWRVEQGKAVKIAEPTRCKPGVIWLDDVGHWPEIAIAGASVGAGAAGAGVVAYYFSNRQPISAVGP